MKSVIYLPRAKGIREGDLPPFAGFHRSIVDIARSGEMSHLSLHESQRRVDTRPTRFGNEITETDQARYFARCCREPRPQEKAK